MSDHFHAFDDEQQWLRPPPRRHRWLLLGLPLLAALTVASLAFGERSFGERSEVLEPAHKVPAGPTAEQRALEAGRGALAAWGRFAVTNQLGTLHGWFWATGPQYRELAREAKLRRGTKGLGPPAYRFTLTRVRVLAPSPRHRILRGRVRVTRPGERSQSYGWDVWMRRGGASGDRWRLWTVKPTRGPRGRSATSPVVVAAGDIAEAGGHQQLTWTGCWSWTPTACCCSATTSTGAGRWPSTGVSTVRPGAAQGQDQAGTGQPRARDPPSGRLLRLLRQGGQAQGPQLLQLRPGRLAPGRAELQHRPRARVGPGALAANRPGRHRPALHPGLLALPALLLRRPSGELGLARHRVERPARRPRRRGLERP